MRSLAGLLALIFKKKKLWRVSGCKATCVKCILKNIAEKHGGVYM
jgi:hypothetical protein